MISDAVDKRIAERRLRAGSATLRRASAQRSASALPDGVAADAAAPGVLAAIGGTPLVELRRAYPGATFRLFAKLEALNPGGSIKDRPARTILLEELRRGGLQPGRSVVVESSSGNFGIGLAQLCRYFGLRFVCVVDPKTTKQNVALLRAYGAEVVVVEKPDSETGEFLPARVRRVQELVARIPHAYWPNQYANPLNARAHHETMREIATRVRGSVDYLFLPTSSCGTLRGCAEYIRENGLATRVVAVDAVGSVIFGQPAGKRVLPGHGAAIRPALYRDGLADEVVHVTDLECVAGCRRLAGEEAILAGASSGAALAAVGKIGQSIPSGATCVAMFPDRGERYLDTIYDDAWVERQFGHVPAAWGAAPC